MRPAVFVLKERIWIGIKQTDKRNKRQQPERVQVESNRLRVSETCQRLPTINTGLHGTLKTILSQRCPAKVVKITWSVCVHHQHGVTSLILPPVDLLIHSSWTHEGLLVDDWTFNRLDFPGNKNKHVKPRTSVTCMEMEMDWGVHFWSAWQKARPKSVSESND